MTQQEPASVSSAQIVPDRSLPSLPLHWTNLSSAFVHSARSGSKVQAISDGNGESLTYGELFQRAAALSRVLSRVLDDNPYVAIMLPPSVGAVVVNVAVTLLGKVAVNVNYMSKQTAVDVVLDRCNLKQCISTAEVIERFQLKIPDFIEAKELKSKVTTADSLFTLAAQYAPLAVLRKMLPGLQRGLDDTATVIFTSGSTGEGKGVILSNRNILSNILQIREHAQVQDDTVVMGILPFFHSLGYTVTLWAVLANLWEGVYHSNPLEAQKIGELMQEYGVTIMACTPTLMRPFLRRCSKEVFKTVQWLLLGSEKLKPELAGDIQEKLGIEPVEGYGATELSPVVAANVLRKVRTPDGRLVKGNKLGSVGQAVPGTLVKTVDLATGADLACGQAGVLHYNGPQVFQGYLGLPEKTAAVLDKNGWYNSGDYGYVDEDGFIYITDRVSRFAKIGGEMVPLVLVENAIRQLTKAADELSVFLVTLPDEKKGEKIAVVYTAGLGHEPRQVCDLLNSTDMSKLWIPSASDFVLVEALPVAGTGKLDQKAVKAIAAERLGA